MSDDAAQQAAAQAAARAKVEESMARLTEAARAFEQSAKSQAQVDLAALIDPEGEAIASLVDGENSAGAASLATPMDVILFETWVLGHLGDREELDMDVNTHKEVFFNFGAWLGETLRTRHGGFWLFVGDDPRGWRIGFTKILLEIAPHTFAERLIKSGQGLSKRMLGEIDRIRQSHADQAAKDGGQPQDRFTPNHYARLHTVPFGQWLVLDMATVSEAWGKKPVAELGPLLSEAGKRLPPQNAPVLARILEALAQLDATKPAAEQVPDRALYEAVAQILGMRAATQPIAIDLVEKLVMPALHVGVPAKFPPLGEDDLENIKKGQDLFAIYVDVVPYATPAVEGGFLGTFDQGELGTPYADRKDLDLGRGDWLAVNPKRAKDLVAHYDPKAMLEGYDRFVEYVQKQDGVPRLRETARATAENVARALAELKACVQAVGNGHALVFRLLPPPA